MRVYHTSTASVDPPVSKYTGVRHARLTHSMKRLTPALKTLLIELRYRLADNQSAALSNRILARATGYGEGYISLLVRQLAGETVTIQQRDRVLTYAGVGVPFIQRVWNEDVGGFVITMLPPPELRPKIVVQPTPQPSPPAEPSSAPLSEALPEAIQLPMFREEDFAGDHPIDPRSQPASGAPERPKAPQCGDHVDDPLLLIHVHAESQQHAAPPETQRAQTQPGSDTSPPAQFSLPEAWLLMRAGTPGYSHADYVRDRLKAETRALREHPDQLIVWSVSRGQPVYSAGELRLRQQQIGSKPGMSSQGADNVERASDSRDSTRHRSQSGDRRADRGRPYPTQRPAELDGSTCRLSLDELPAFLRPSQSNAAAQRSATPAGVSPLSELPAFLRVRDV